MADNNGGEKRKADEMTADSVELPLAELKSLAEKGGETKHTTGKRDTLYEVVYTISQHVPWSLAP